MILNSIDIIILTIIITFSLLGFYWGLIRQLISIVFLIAGIVFASQYNQNIAGVLLFVVPNTNIVDLVGFVIIVVGVSVIGLLLSSTLHYSIDFIFLSMISRMFGSIIGLFQGAIIVTVMIAIFAANPDDQISEILRDSQFTIIILKHFKFVLALMPTTLRQSMEIFFGSL